jgi:hypothetical protein
MYGGDGQEVIDGEITASRYTGRWGGQRIAVRWETTMRGVDGGETTVGMDRVRRGA